MKPYQDTENRILGNLLRSPLQSKSMLALAKAAGLTYVTVHKAVPLLAKRKIVRMEKKGKASLISADLEHADTAKLSAAMENEKSIFLKKHPELAVMVREIGEALAGSFYILLLFGSHAKENAKKDSDTDLLFIVPDGEKRETYSESINNALKIFPKGRNDYGLFKAKDFMDMLNQKGTAGREAFLNSIVLFGAEQYYAMVKEYARTKGY